MGTVLRAGEHGGRKMHGWTMQDGHQEKQVQGDRGGHRPAAAISACEEKVHASPASQDVSVPV
jgi:hypothetical protein